MKIKYFKTRKKITFIFIKNESSMFYSSITLAVGSVNEKPKEYGLAHFFEHMIFKGTTKRPNVTLDLDKLGTLSNAYTYYDHTKYYISGNVADYQEILDILFDMLLNPVFPEDQIKNERNVVIQELKSRDDDNYSKAYDKLTEMIYKDTDKPYSIPVIGKEKFISNFTRENLKKFYKNQYLKKEKIVTICGNFNLKSVVSYLEKILKMKLLPYKPTFMNLISQKEKIPYFTNNSKMQIKTINEETNQTVVIMGFRFYSLYHKDTYTMDLLSGILTKGFSSLLFELLRNKLGLTYYQHSEQINFRNHGYFYIGFGVKSNSVVKAINAVIEEIKQLKKNGVTQSQLDIAKKLIINRLIEKYEDPQSLVGYVTLSKMYSTKPLSLKEQEREYESITVEHINSVVNEVFVSGNTFIVINGKNVSPEMKKSVKDF